MSVIVTRAEQHTGHRESTPLVTTLKRKNSALSPKENRSELTDCKNANEYIIKYMISLKYLEDWDAKNGRFGNQK